jgi:hypothetical protein
MFGLGSREAVAGALSGDVTGFGAAAPVEVLLEAFATLGLPGRPDDRGGVAVPLPSSPRAAGAAAARLEALATAHGWTRTDDAPEADTALFRGTTP